MGHFNFRVVFRIISNNLFILSAALLISGAVAILAGEQVSPFLETAALAFAVGLMLYYAARGKADHHPLNRKEAYLTVTLTWLIMSLTGSLPYLISGAIPSVTDAIFESVSGFTTTGSSILADIEVLPKSILFWRSLTHWIGGIGIIVLVIIIMPALRIGGYHLFTMESSLQEKISPRIKTVGIYLLYIYIAMTAAEILLLLAGGMNIFESACHAFGTVATGGFSPRNSSIAGYSPYIQYVITLFMLLAGVNFIIPYYLVKKDFLKIRQNEEFRFYLVVIFIIGTFISLSLMKDMGKSAETAFREGFFQVVSIITCTGFATADYLQWPVYAWLIIFFCMFLGGSTGSTAGGIKMVRHLIVMKNIRIIFKRLSSPHAMLPIRLNKKTLNEEANNSVLTFVTLYLMVFISGSVMLVLLGLDGATSASSVATCMAGIGPGIGTVGPVSNFAHLPQAAKIILSLLMITGRLEIYTVLILFSPSYWKK
ncbi:MAG: TrkH family potassium uptake protein [Lentimicrobium sp.]|nr:TrkH family potassium uptake protein [Lentimicrobium sp.]